MSDALHAEGSEYEQGFRGITVLPGTQMRFTSLTIEDGRAVPEGLQLRWDSWPAWLSVAESSGNRSAAARASNPGPDDSEAFGVALFAEMSHGMASICACAFTLESFTNSVVEMRPGSAPPRPDGTDDLSAFARVYDIWCHAFRVPNHWSRDVRPMLQKIFRYRNEAVHPSEGFSNPILHETYHVALHERHAKYSADSAEGAVSFDRQILALLPTVAHPGRQEWSAWCQRQLEQIAAIPKI